VTLTVLLALDRAIGEASPEERPALVVALAARLAQLAAASLTTPAPGTGRFVETDANLSAVEAARRLGISKDWLYRNAERLPFAVRIGRRVLFSARGLERWNAQRRRS
jgi:predicted DNA-binding transcriptional regulator AlpA